MSPLEVYLCCPNPDCAAPLNPMGGQVCAHCQTPLIYRYLWAVGTLAEKTPPGTQIGGHYYVTAPQIWLDTQPGLNPDRLAVDWPDEVLSYLHLYPYRLHLPEVYGFYAAESEPDLPPVVLLENAPINAKGLLYPAITHVWSQATAVRQLYWLWQLLELWSPLQAQGVAASLLAADNIRVEGWRIRLCQLIPDRRVLGEAAGAAMEQPGQESAFSPLGLADLANLWLNWIELAQPAIAKSLWELCRQMQGEEVGQPEIATQLNHLLLEQAAQLPLKLKTTGLTEAGPQRSHNEDACFPATGNAPNAANQLVPRVAIVCDGIGGHEGGEVASQLAVQSLTLQLQAYLAEFGSQTELIPPDVIANQLSSLVRVVNNLIANQNDAQGREARRRMGTTLAMALQIPQSVPLSVEAAAGNGVSDNSHELYLVHVGDSRAYWITRQYCHQLTVDDDVVTREVRFGRALTREALMRPDAGSLTQALGTRDADFLNPTIQRFIIEEDGLLLLCSDGLCDNGLVEKYWDSLTEPVFSRQASLEQTAQNWISLANQQNGHDNASIVLMWCQVAPVQSDVSLPPMPEAEKESQWSPASQVLAEEDMVGTATSPTSPPRQRQPRSWIGPLAAVVGLLVLIGGAGLATWSALDPVGFQQFRQRLGGGASPDASPTPGASPLPEISPMPDVRPLPEASPTPEISPLPEASPTPEASPAPEASP